MPSYKTLIIIFLSMFFASCVGNKDLQRNDVKLFEAEDQYILFALEYEKNRDFYSARQVYLELFDKTERYEYLLRFLTISMQLSRYEDVKEYSYKYLDEDSSSYEDVLRFYTIALLKLDKLDEALKNATVLLEKFNNSKNYELIANVYFEREEYKQAEEHFESAYISNVSGDTLINLVDVLYSYLNKKEKAISYLETHVRLYGCEGGVCTKLFSFYREQKNIDGIISILKKSYFEYKTHGDFYSMNRAYKYLIAYLEQKNIDEAIKFLEENRVDDFKLLTLYQKKDDKKKALQLLEELYKSTGNIDLLAQMAIFKFEVAKDKKKVLADVIKKFESALIILDNHIYQNFLGYLLIDYDIDIKRGVSLVEKALKKAPNNVAYIDSYAWGLYKQKKCKEAYIQMKKVVDAIGLDEPEIKMHWNKIKECK
ncbi:tetratricopeptide repeat protein [Malaciobacter halophilus]|nr:tetratricopeptide repeat protein [Malaciobacter halophilus]